MADHAGARVIAVPYDSGHRGLRMGAGPERLLDGGLMAALERKGATPGLAVIHPECELPTEVATAFELDGLVSERGREAVAEGEFPLVLSGNCNTAVGTVAGVGSEDLGVVWFDAHPDFNTPETTTTGFSDGMGLAVAVGHCWKEMSRRIPGFSPLAESNVVLVGTRDMSPAERARLDDSGVAVVAVRPTEHETSRALAKALDELRTRVGRVYVHLDLDVLDPTSVAPANQFAPESGMDAEALLAALGMIRERFVVAASGIASYDPAFDPHERILGVALACAGLLAASEPAAAQGP
jgi:arginase